jgi:hypothetical protein
VSEKLTKTGYCIARLFFSVILDKNEPTKIFKSAKTEQTEQSIWENK